MMDFVRVSMFANNMSNNNLFFPVPLKIETNVAVEWRY